MYVSLLTRQALTGDKTKQAGVATYLYLYVYSHGLCPVIIEQALSDIWCVWREWDRNQTVLCQFFFQPPAAYALYVAFLVYLPLSLHKTRRDSGKRQAGRAQRRKEGRMVDLLDVVFIHHRHVLLFLPAATSFWHVHAPCCLPAALPCSVCVHCIWWDGLGWTLSHGGGVLNSGSRQQQHFWQL